MSVTYRLDSSSGLSNRGPRPRKSWGDDGEAIFRGTLGRRRRVHPWPNESGRRKRSGGETSSWPWVPTSRLGRHTFLSPSRGSGNKQRFKSGLQICKQNTNKTCKVALRVPAKYLLERQEESLVDRGRGVWRTETLVRRTVVDYKGRIGVMCKVDFYG